jgi:hypothetical protein
MSLMRPAPTPWNYRNGRPILNTPTVAALEAPA